MILHYLKSYCEYSWLVSIGRSGLPILLLGTNITPFYINNPADVVKSE